MKMKTIVHIEWIDAATTPNWVGDPCAACPVPVDTVGFLVGEDDKIVRVALSVAANGLVADIIAIPRVNIVVLESARKYLRREK